MLGAKLNLRQQANALLQQDSQARSNITKATGDENKDPFADLDGDFQGLIDQVASGSSVTPQMYTGSVEEPPVCFNADVNE